uniref:SZT2 subunit of KICSTOR complex n=1 Tax=Sus scrofa TaxID=9823 RepID=A0A8D1TGF6_PIG
MASERPEPEVEEAGHVFLLMKKDYRISRNVRLAWFLNHLHQTVQATPQEMLSEQELEVLSVLPPGWQPDEPVVPRPFLLVPSTRVTFLAWQYRFVIELDLSPSTGIVDDSTGEILFDEVFHALSRCLGGLLRPFRVPGSCIDFQPEIYVTIQAYSSIIGLQSHQVLHPCSALASSDLVAKSPLTKSLSDLYSPCPKSPAVLEPVPWSSP